jgi:hypothetical protein
MEWRIIMIGEDMEILTGLKKILMDWRMTTGEDMETLTGLIRILIEWRMTMMGEGMAMRVTDLKVKMARQEDIAESVTIWIPMIMETTRIPTEVSTTMALETIGSNPTMYVSQKIFVITNRYMCNLHILHLCYF